MRTVEYTGTLTALSSIAHGGEKLYTEHKLRREPVFVDGRRVMVPIISGGGIRGILRRVATDMTFSALGGQPLPWTTVSALRRGGAITATSKRSDVITSERQAHLRSLVPLIGVFGASGGGRVMSGRLVVDKAVPIATETRALFPDHNHTDDAYPSIHTIVQSERYSVHPDNPDQQVTAHTDVTDKAGGLMRYGHETLVAGTRFWHSLLLEDATPLEQSFLDDLVRVWSRRARIGGQHARGMGRVKVDYTRTVEDGLGETAEPEAADWRAHLTDNRGDVLEALSWL